MAPWFLRPVYLILLCILIGLPINTLWQLSILIVGLILVFTQQPEITRKRFLIACSIFTASFGISHFYTVPQIEEGHNVFLPAPTGQVLEDQLPADIYQWLETSFNERFPVERACQGMAKSDWKNCWKTTAGPKSLYAFSSDGLWQEKLYSRRISSAFYNGLSGLNAGFVNDGAYNWYDWTSDVKRAEMPFFVFYDFNALQHDVEMCWQGKTAWIDHEGVTEFKENTAFECQLISAQDDLKLYVNGVVPIKVSIKPQYLFLDMWPYLQIILCFGFLVSVLKIKSVRIFAPTSLSLAGVFGILFFAPDLFVQMPVYAGGLDGLTHDGHARTMLQALDQGNWLEVLRGGANVFYYMPGLRYFRFLEHVLFGETAYGYLLVLIFLPLLFFVFLRCFMPLGWCWAVMVLFLATPYVRSFGLSFERYIDNAFQGFPGSLGYGLFLFACLLSFEFVKSCETSKNYTYRFLSIGLLMALAVFMRPNLAPGAGVFLTGIVCLLLSRNHWKFVVFLSLGFVPVLFMPWHNWYFGDVFVPMTRAATESVNYHAPPALWLEAMKHVLQGSFDHASILKIWDQWSLWSKGFHPLHIIAFFSTLFLAISPFYVSAMIRLLAWVALSQHAVLWVFTAHSRYAWLAWLLSFVLTVVLVRSLLHRFAQRLSFDFNFGYGSPLFDDKSIGFGKNKS